MEVALAEQEELFVIIHKAIVHFKELTQPHMTRGHIQTRINGLDEYYHKFRTKHFELVKMASAAGIKKEDYPYFKHEMFYLADDMYNKTKGIMADELEKIDSPNDKIDWKILASSNEETLIIIKKVGVNVKTLSEPLKTRGYIQARISTLEEYWQRFCTTHFEILKLSTGSEKGEHIYFKQDIFSQCEEEYITIKGMLADILDKLDCPTVKVNHETDASSEEVKQLNVNSAQLLEKKDEWNSFKDVCGALIHDNPTLENIQNIIEQASHVLNYLKPAEIEKENDNAVKKTLKLNNSRQEVHSLLQRLIFDQERIVRPTSISVKELIDETQYCLRHLEERIDISNWDTILIYIIKEKIDVESHIQWVRKEEMLAADELPTLTQFMNFLDTRYRALKEQDDINENDDEITFCKPVLSHVPNNTAQNMKLKPFCYECGKFGHYGHECQYHE